MANATWTGSGTGTETDPYIIETGAQYYEFFCDPSDSYYTLAGDIDCGSTPLLGSTPGDLDYAGPDRTKFDGRGFTVKFIISHVTNSHRQVGIIKQHHQLYGWFKNASLVVSYGHQATAWKPQAMLYINDNFDAEGLALTHTVLENLLVDTTLFPAGDGTFSFTSIQRDFIIARSVILRPHTRYVLSSNASADRRSWCSGVYVYPSTSQWDGFAHGLASPPEDSKFLAEGYPDLDWTRWRTRKNDFPELIKMPLPNFGPIRGHVYKDVGDAALRTVSLNSNESVRPAISANGDFTVTGLPDGDTVYVYAIPAEGYGTVFAPSTDIAVNQVIRPLVHNGFVYTCTVAGTLPSAEPAQWVTTEDGIQTLGDVTLRANRIKTPIATGPLRGKRLRGEPQ